LVKLVEDRYVLYLHERPGVSFCHVYFHQLPLEPVAHHPRFQPSHVGHRPAVVQYDHVVFVVVALVFHPEHLVFRVREDLVYFIVDFCFAGVQHSVDLLWRQLLRLDDKRLFVPDVGDH